MRIFDQINLINYELERKKIENIELNNSDHYIPYTEHWFSDED